MIKTEIFFDLWKLRDFEELKIKKNRKTAQRDRVCKSTSYSKMGTSEQRSKPQAYMESEDGEKRLP